MRAPRSDGRRRGALLAAGLVAAGVLVAACSSGSSSSTPRVDDPAIGVQRSGGKATVFDTSANAFAIAIPSLDRIERRAFSVGNSFFNDNWVTAPASTEGRDGLGPLFNAQSCSSCHFRDGRGKPPVDDDDPERGLLLRLSVPGTGPHGEIVPDPAYGDQLQDRGISGVPAEGRISITTEKVARPLRRRRSVHLGRPHVRRRRHRVRPARIRRAALASDRARRVRRRPARGDPRGRCRRPGRPRRRRRRRHLGDARTRCGTCVPRRWRWAGSGGRRTCRPSSSRTPARSTATSASPARCSRRSRAPRSRPHVSPHPPAVIPRSTTRSSGG